MSLPAVTSASQQQPICPREKERADYEKLKAEWGILNAKKLGAGTFGTVYKLPQGPYNPNNDRVVKIIPSIFFHPHPPQSIKFATNKLQEDFEYTYAREIKIFTEEKIRNLPCFPKMIGYFSYPPCYCHEFEFSLIMEEIPGETLWKVGKFDDYDKLHAAIFWLFGSLRELHATKHVHGDLNPSNALFNPDDNTIKFVDLGAILRCQGDSSQFFNTCTPCFAPPEVCNGETSSLPVGEIFSAGAIVFYMLTGKILMMVNDNKTEEQRQEIDQYAKKRLLDVTSPDFWIHDAMDALNQLPIHGHSKMLTLDFLRQAIAYDHTKRFQSAESSLRHPQFSATFTFNASPSNRHFFKIIDHEHTIYTIEPRHFENGPHTICLIKQLLFTIALLERDDESGFLNEICRVKLPIHQGDTLFFDIDDLAIYKEKSNEHSLLHEKSEKVLADQEEQKED